MKKVLIVCPNAWERQQLAGTPFVHGRYELIFHGGDAETAPDQFDALAFVDRTVKQFRDCGIDGVASSSDYPGCLVAAAIARGLGLPGPDLAALLRCSHKYYARLAQAETVPEATPRFALIDPADPRVSDDLRFPLFVKPVKSWFSVFAQRIESPEELRAFVERPAVRTFLDEFTRPFNQLLRRYTDFDLDARYLLAEEIATGEQVTLEGFVRDGEVEIVGITDSIMHPGTISFARFDYPSALPSAVQARMADIARRAIRHVDLTDSLFNVELFYDAATDAIRIIEINPRMVGQFADLMEKVDGRNTFEILLALATGQPPPKRRSGRYSRAASFPLRVFEDRQIVRLPDAADLDRVRARHPDTLLTLYYHEVGKRLSDAGDDQNDMASYCYGILNMGGDDLPSLIAAADQARNALGFVLEPA